MFHTQHGSVGPGSLVAEALAGVPSVQCPQSMLSLLADAGPAHNGVQHSAVDGHALRHIGVRMGEFYKLHCSRHLNTETGKSEAGRLGTLTRF